MGFEVQSLKQLLGMELPPMRWVIAGLIGEGLTLFAGKPKMGKSFLMLNLAIAVATGGLAFGNSRVSQGRVLYLALEDSPHRMQDRAKKMLGKEEIPDMVDVVYRSPMLGQGLEETLTEYLDEHPETKLVIIDTLAKVKPLLGVNASEAYSVESSLIAPLKVLADDRHLAIVLVHHTRKTVGADAFDEIAGSNGPFAIADTALVLTRTRNNNQAVLKATGRDIVEQEYQMQFDSDVSTWVMSGTGPQLELSSERREVLEAINHNGGRASLRQIVLATGKEIGVIKRRISTMRGIYVVPVDGERGVYQTTDVCKGIGIDDKVDTFFEEEEGAVA